MDLESNFSLFPHATYHVTFVMVLAVWFFISFRFLGNDGWDCSALAVLKKSSDIKSGNQEGQSVYLD